MTALGGDSGLFIGEREYTSAPGVYYFEVPQAIRRIHVCAIGGGAQGAVSSDSSDYEFDHDGGGGGGLGWENNIVVEPGEILYVKVGGDSGVKRTEDDNATPIEGDDIPNDGWIVAGLTPTRRNGYGDGGKFIGTGGGEGGRGSIRTLMNGGSVASRGSGGGAGGYRGNGGDGKTNGGSMTEIFGGGGSGGHSSYKAPSNKPETVDGFRGGGVGVRGEGPSGPPAITDPLGIDSSYTGKPGNPGSGGEKYDFGAGGAGNRYGWDGSEDTKAGHGAVRIIWGNRFSYPDNADVEA